MKVTVCELRDDPDALAKDWDALVAHVTSEGSELVLLPEMPFYPWIARTNQVEDTVWEASVTAHDRWMERFQALSPARIAGTRPVVWGERRFNEGFLWDPVSGYQAAHLKYYLPDESGFWEASWYERGSRTFTPIKGGDASMGFLICTELWFPEHARTYGRQGVQLILCPRATPSSSGDKWLAGARVAAVTSGAFCLSSNRGGKDAHGMTWAGLGWIVEPEEGEILGITSQDQPFLTIDLDLAAADHAKGSYPRYVPE